MILEELLKDRDRWQEETIEEVRQNLSEKPKFVSPSNRKSERRVAVFGSPQVGKTTLILFLMGLKEEYREEVDAILRAGRAKGKSSTSTAIMYQISDTDKFGMRIETNKTDINNKDVRYFQNKEGVIHELKKIRENMKASKVVEKEILYLYLPNYYFDEKNFNKSNINILDLPGERSSSIEESNHVENILKEYLSTAQVNLIVCRGDHIQSLENMKLPAAMADWKFFPYKYLIVVTNAYSQDSVRNYFNKNKNPGKEAFWEFVNEEYKKEEILLKLTAFEQFFIEVGDSLKILEKSLESEADKEKLQYALDRTVLDLETAINKRKGNSLKGIIEELRAYSEHALESKQRELQGEINKLEETIWEEKRSLQQLENQLQTIESGILHHREAAEQYERLGKLQITVPIEKYREGIAGYIQEEFDKKIKNKKQKEELQKWTWQTLKDYIAHYLEKEYKTGIYLDTDVFANLNTEQVWNQIMEKEPFKELETLLSQRVGGIFSKKISCEKYIELLKQAYDDCEKMFEEILKAEIGKAISYNKNQYEYYNGLKNSKKNIERDKEKTNRGIQSKYNKQAKKESELNKLDAEKKQNEKLIVEYYKIAKMKYASQTKEIREKLKMKSISSADKVQYIVFLGLLEKDYAYIIGEER